MKDNTVIGSLVFGNWKVKELIGAGSFGSVYKIEREEYGHTYTAAMKLISIPATAEELEEIRSTSTDEDSVRSYFNNVVRELVNEITLMDKLKGNSNVVSYEDHLVVEKENQIGWDIYIKMELLTPMNVCLEQSEFTVADVILLGTHICKALEFCVKNGIIHRDIKPQNIFISKHGYFKLGDFGISKQLEREVLVQSKKGTFAYMAPEVYLGKAYDESVDTYSLGLVLYRLLNDNRTPFLPYHPAAITYADKENSLSSRMSGLAIPPPRLAIEPLVKIIFKACAFKREYRYKSAAEMSADLEKIELEPYKKFKISGNGTDIDEASSSKLFGGKDSFVIPNSLPQSKESFEVEDENITTQEEVWGTRKSVNQIAKKEQSQDYSELFEATEKKYDPLSEAINNPSQEQIPKTKENMITIFKQYSLLKKTLIIVPAFFTMLCVIFVLLVIFIPDNPKSSSTTNAQKVTTNSVVSNPKDSKIKNGFDKLKYDNGDYYEGNFVNGKKQGKGTYTYANGNIYEGNFVNDLREDTKGKLTFASGVIYIGTFTKGKITGYGEKQYKDGIYKGNFVNGNREGTGTFYYSAASYAGDYYKGEWKADKQNGTGEYYDSSKNERKSTVWENGKRISK